MPNLIPPVCPALIKRDTTEQEHSSAANEYKFPSPLPPSPNQHYATSAGNRETTRDRLPHAEPHSRANTCPAGVRNRDVHGRRPVRVPADGRVQPSCSDPPRVGDGVKRRNTPSPSGTGSSH
ncbi:hypothetical protein SKAU_G00291000 [Synaphobranchus kaupii]|uniref:Uncharacterized protein n=1 Tax=Synaphobranchus kaupii TaxID=118154 RepID=A0A9Q1ILC8_SYNKA|nr:hypothetical protein SKAU_G00291000 [Synaphobranchus kaupii]